MRDLDLTPSQFGLVGSSFFFLFSVSAVVGGFIANRVETRWVLLAMAMVWAVAQFPMIGSARGVPSRLARGMFAGACVAAGGLAFMLVPHVPSRELKIAVPIAGGTLPGVIYVISHAVVSKFIPVRQRGAILAIGNAFGTTAGLLAPYVMGNIIEQAATPAAGFLQGFVVCGAIIFVSGAIGMIFIKPERETRFAQALGAVPRAAAI